MRIPAALAACLMLITPVMALAHDGVHILDAYARILPGSKTGAVYLIIENHEAGDEHLLSVATDAARTAEIHESRVDANGMASMPKIAGALTIPAESSFELKQDSDHIMLIGLTRKFKTGDILTLTLTFGHAGVVKVEVPVNNSH